MIVLGAQYHDLEIERAVVLCGVMEQRSCSAEGVQGASVEHGVHTVLRTEGRGCLTTFSSQQLPWAPPWSPPCILCTDLYISSLSDGVCHGKISVDWTSLVVQWLRIHRPLQGTWVQFLVREDPACHRAAKAVRHNY